MDNDIFVEENYTQEEVKINMLRANIFGFLFLVAVIILFGIPFYLMWHERYQSVRIIDFSMSIQRRLLNTGFWLLIIVPGIILHELIHGIFFMLCTKKGLKSLKFGIMPINKLCTPYCICLEKIKVKHFRIAAIMPMIILGIIPTIVFLFIGNIFLFIYSMIFIAGGAVDMLFILKTVKEKDNTWILNFPSGLGFYIYRQKIKE